MAKKRSVKVYGQRGYKYKETPTIMLKGGDGCNIREASAEVKQRLSGC